MSQRFANTQGDITTANSVVASLKPDIANPDNTRNPDTAANSASPANTSNPANSATASNDLSAYAAANAVVVKASARLHMGFFDLNGSLGRRFGSIGLSLDQPVFVIKAYAAQGISADADSIIPAPAAAALIERSIALASKLSNGLASGQGIHIQLQAIIPQHAGLGSGTQLSLAIGAALNYLYGLDLTIAELAMKTQRGARSGIGLGTFASGGVIIDGGRGEHTAIPPVIARLAFPQAWRILLIFDHGHVGVHGNTEIAAFRSLASMPEETAADLCRHMLMQALPALAEHDLTSFGNAIRVLQERTGDYFAPVQGGRYASPRVAQVLQWLHERGALCMGQSSWGPTSFAIFADSEQAQAMQSQLQAQFEHAGELQFVLCQGNNQGAVVSTA